MLLQDQKPGLKNDLFFAVCVAGVFTIVFPQCYAEGHFFFEQACMSLCSDHSWSLGPLPRGSDTGLEAHF